jgi:diaminohydroxyphosphoribosylaminopyrimidine deaminase/5-amino-6-(5-phosphoribosylamino)uracil reductase
MRMAIRLARRGVNRPSREPLVGAVVAVGDRVVGRGFADEHRSVHAVIAALNDSGERAPGAAVYTNIESCGDGGDEEACVRHLIESRVTRLVVGIATGNDQFSDASRSILNRLRSARIEVEIGVCEEACREVNEKYLKYSATGLPFVTLKFAASIDGRIATAAGESQWITGPSARRFAHKLRREHDAVMVGIGTVLSDDPQLTVRLAKGRDPLRIIVDSNLRTPLTARVFTGGAAANTLIVTTESSDAGRATEIERLGSEVLRLPGSSGGDSGVNLARLFEELGRRGIASVLVEGGKRINTSLLKARTVDRLVAIMAPKIIGQGTEAIGDLGLTRLDDAIAFASVKTGRLGPDIVFDARLK